MNPIISKLNDGGPVISYTILVLILVIIGLFIKALLERESQHLKIRSLIASIGWFALAWGYLGRTFGLIMAFDKIAVAGEITPSLMAGGLKMALIGPLLGISAFIIARIGIIVLALLERSAVRD
ncbi:MAG: MotA/TolQ/ExbB proton channel family protein [Bacteroidales bacterium]|nr:MotA/TolQ/ExbB proton channel family protein [Bacteroidales bacterium]